MANGASFDETSGGGSPRIREGASVNTRQIDCILELSQTLSFKRAAENLFISQPTLSYQIKEAEEEVGFSLFDRSGRGTALTPAGVQFCTSLRTIREEYQRAVEQGQNFSSRYRESLVVGLPMRSALRRLPEAIVRMAGAHPDIQVTPSFNALGDPDAFLRGEQDLCFALEEDVRRIASVQVLPLYRSRICLIARVNDPLARKRLVTADDLRGRTLMVGGGSPAALRAVQHRVVSQLGIRHFNSHDHDTTLVNVAAARGVCLAPDFLDDGCGAFAWVPFDCEETVSCVLCVHAAERREEVLAFARLLQELHARP